MLLAKRWRASKNGYAYIRTLTKRDKRLKLSSRETSLRERKRLRLRYATRHTPVALRNTSSLSHPLSFFSLFFRASLAGDASYKTHAQTRQRAWNSHCFGQSRHTHFPRIVATYAETLSLARRPLSLSQLVFVRTLFSRSNTRRARASPV